jgi:hypothetical protein
MPVENEEVAHLLGKDGDWTRVWNELKKRRGLLKALSEGQGEKSEFDLNAIDLFVEKAQVPLSKRGDRFQTIGISLSFVAVMLIVYLILKAQSTDFHHDLVMIEAARQPVLAFLLYLVQKLTLGGIVLGLAIYLAGLSRSYMHESLTAFGRRHAVRLGRLYLYLKLGGLPKDKLFEEKNNLEIEKFIIAFGGHKEATTAFKEIKSEEQLSAGWFSSLTGAIRGMFTKDILKKS